MHCIRGAVAIQRELLRVAGQGNEVVTGQSRRLATIQTSAVPGTCPWACKSSVQCGAMAFLRAARSVAIAVRLTWSEGAPDMTRHASPQKGEDQIRHPERLVVTPAAPRSA